MFKEISEAHCFCANQENKIRIELVVKKFNDG